MRSCFIDGAGGNGLVKQYACRYCRGHACLWGCLQRRPQPAGIAVGMQAPSYSQWDNLFQAVNIQYAVYHGYAAAKFNYLVRYTDNYMMNRKFFEKDRWLKEVTTLTTGEHV